MISATRDRLRRLFGLSPSRPPYARTVTVSVPQRWDMYHVRLRVADYLASHYSHPTSAMVEHITTAYLQRLAARLYADTTGAVTWEGNALRFDPRETDINAAAFIDHRRGLHFGAAALVERAGESVSIGATIRALREGR